MTVHLVDRLLAEAVHLPREADPAHVAVRWAILIEDSLGVVLSDDQIASIAVVGPDPVSLRSLVAASAPQA